MSENDFFAAAAAEAAVAIVVVVDDDGINDNQFVSKRISCCFATWWQF